MSRRLGRNKALEPFEGEPLIQRVITRMGQVGDSVAVIVNELRTGATELNLTCPKKLRGKLLIGIRVRDHWAEL